MANELFRDQFRTGADIFQVLRREMDRVISQFGLPGQLGLQTEQQGQIIPPADIIEDDSAFRITLDIPGIDPKEVEVTQASNLLMIRAERRGEQEQRGRTLIASERSYGTVRREFHIPDRVDRTRISADFRNGLLTLILPKSQDARDQTRRIEIKSA